MTERAGLSLAAPDMAVERRTDGSVLLRSNTKLLPHPARIGDVLVRAATQVPDRVFLAERRGAAWDRITYGATMAQAEAVAQYLVDRGLDERAPVAILSGNSIRHALLSLGAALVGVPVVPVTPAYSLAGRDSGRLRSVVDTVRPALMFADDAEQYAPALQAVGGGGRIVVTGTGGLPGAVPFGELLDTRVDATRLGPRMAQVTARHTARYMLTSGSTGTPKPVVTTHGMLCANQQMIVQLWPFLDDEPPVLVDWLPWSHTYGGGKIFNLTLWHAGTLHLDDGKPVPGAMEATLANLREISPTLYFNVPRGFALLVPALEADERLRERFFARLRMINFGAAALPDHLWRRLRELSQLARGGEPVFVTAGFGSTETSPTSTLVHFPTSDPRVIGLPAPGVELKLVPADGGKMEVRVRGPHVTPGYVGPPDWTREAFDDDGYFRLGDAVRFVDPADPARGLAFDGRLSEDFKLSTGTWVSVGRLRVELLAATAPLLSDLVPIAPDRDYLGVLAWLAAGREDDPETVADLVARLRAFNREHSGASETVRRVVLLAEPPSFAGGEITDKQYVNQRAVRERRGAEVERLYAEPAASGVIAIG